MVHNSSICDNWQLFDTAAARTDELLLNSELYTWLSHQPLGPQHPARHFLREVLARKSGEIDQLNYPPSVLQLVHKEFARLERAIKNEDDSYFDIRTHRFRSDVRIALLARIPVGPKHLEIDGIPRRLLYCGGLRQGWRFARLWRRAGGVRPFYVLHFAHGIPPQAFLYVCNPKTQRDMFLRLAECLKMSPSILGVLETSWWHDSQLGEHVPHLKFLRQGWLDGGAEQFRWGTDDGVVQLATSNSSARQKLVDEGKYRPVAYLMVWLRDSLLAWAAGESA